MDGLEVLFPYDFIYPEQYEYMLEYKRALDTRVCCVPPRDRASCPIALLLRQGRTHSVCSFACAVSKSSYADLASEGKHLLPRCTQMGPI